MQKTKPCTITPRSAGKGKYHWTWQAADGKQASGCNFTYFYDCVTDARANGYEVDIVSVVARLKADSSNGAAQSGGNSEVRHAA